MFLCTLYRTSTYDWRNNDCFGLLTRWAIIAQLPILAGAVLVALMNYMATHNLLLAAVTLAICIFFLFYGSGKNSADYYFKMQQ
ncbi:hypothetical protein SLW70_12400 [Flavobacterium sp. NG2]|uniref:hypothetical protein n=1 Tax=Flavobacterium sp. NG2 TaxID=3097547 RepID=UPI002A8110A4|nr:hypothetical protein [Flavobacterium sp. NG2]WPR70728.1 hypothetical protein SLW70_12400 [Flavobacterium sp. NG2]